MEENKREVESVKDDGSYLEICWGCSPSDACWGCWGESEPPEKEEDKN